MTLIITSLPIPLTTDANGIIRVGGTRVTLDTIVAAFNEGATAEEIGYQYPAVSLVDIYTVISYYLQQHAEVAAYLRQQQQAAALIRQQNEAQFDPCGVRERLLARRVSVGPVPAGQVYVEGAYATTGR